MIHPNSRKPRGKHLRPKKGLRTAVRLFSTWAAVNTLVVAMVGAPGMTSALATDDVPPEIMNIAAIGCSNTNRVVRTYQALSQKGLLINAAWAGKTTTVWATTDQPWNSYYLPNRPLEGYDAAWVELCEQASNGLTQENVELILGRIWAIDPEIPVFLSPMNFYENELCAVSNGNDVPTQGALIADSLAAADARVLRGPDLGPLTAEMLRTDNCHGNDAGHTLIAQQLKDFFDDDPPEVVITSPADGATVGGIVSIEVEATDDIGVTYVEFFINDEPIGSDALAPYGADWDSTTVYDGEFTVSAVAYDTLDKQSSHELQFVVDNDNVNTEPIAVIAGDGSGMVFSQVDVSVTFDGSPSFDNEGSIVSWLWDLGDGTTISGAVVEHQYSTPGTYTVVLAVADDGDLTAEAQLIVEVSADQSPTIEIISPTDAEVVTGTVSIVAEADDDLGVVEVAFFVDGILLGSAAESPFQVEWDTTNAYDGSHEISVVVTDTSDQTASHAVVVAVSNGLINTPPTAAINTEGQEGLETLEGLPLALDGTPSHDLEGTIVAFDWDFGDGTFGVGATIEHIYDEPGTYTATLTVTDDGGLVGVASIEVEVSPDEPPTVTITSPVDQSVVAGITVISVDAGDDVAIVSVDFYLDGVLLTGDPDAPYEATWDTTTDYDAAHVVTATATDSIGQTSTHTVNVVVDNGFINLDPTAHIADDGSGQLTGQVGNPVLFDGSGSTDGEGTIVAFDWDFGDGTFGVGATTEHIYDEPGTYTATLTVTDDGGLVGVASIEVEVSPDEPQGLTVVTTGPLLAGQPITFLDSSNSATFRRRWHMGNGTTLSTTGPPTVTYTYTTPGVYTVSLDTKAADGSRVTFSIVVEVG